MERAAGRPRIAIVDDHSEFLDLMRDLLSAEYEVSTYDGDADSASLLANSRPDLLIIDLRLDTADDVEGWDLVTQARAHPDLRSVPIIVCSADSHAVNERPNGLAEAGNAVVLTKPFTLEDLEATLREGLEIGFSDEAVSTPQ